MWRRVEVRNYRSIDYVRADLAPFSLLVGPNGSGKSNFVDAIAFGAEVGFDADEAISKRGGIRLITKRLTPQGLAISSRAATEKTDSEDFPWNYTFNITLASADTWNFEGEIVMAPSAPDGRLLAWYRNDGTRHPHSPVLSRIELPLAPTASIFVSLRQKHGEEMFAPLTRVRRFRFNPDLMYPPHVLNKPELDDKGSNISAAVRDVIKNPEAAERLRRTMAAILPGTMGVTVDEVGGYGLLRLQQQAGSSTASFQPQQLSDGTLRVLATAVAVEQMKKDQLLIIEEPETGLHPGAAGVLFSVLKSAAEKGAVLVTTHSPELLDLAKDEEVLVCEYRDGSTHIGPLAASQRALVKDGLFSVSELMRSAPLRIEGTEPPTLDPRTLDQ